MASISYADRAKLFVTNLQDYLRSEFRPKAILSALANEELKKVEEVNGGYQATVATVKAGALNSGDIKTTDFSQEFPTTGNSITTETMEVNEYDSYNDQLAVKQMDNENAIIRFSQDFGKQRSEQFEQKREIDFVSNYLFAHHKNILTGAETTVAGAVNAGATTFDVADATDIEAGSILFLESITVNGSMRTIPVFVKSIAGTTITIETDTTLLPLGGVNGNKNQFKKINTVLPALAVDARVVIDKPIQATPENIYDVLIDLETAVSEFDVPENGLYIHGQQRVLNMLKKKDSPLVKFQNFLESLKKVVMKKGKIREFEDSTILQNTNGMVRTVQGKQRFYITLFKSNFSINSISWLTETDWDKKGGTAGLGYQHSGVQMYGSEVFEEGSKALAMVVVEL